MASELTSSPAELLAEAVNTVAGDSAASALAMSYGELWGAYHSEVVGGASPHKTMSIPAMMAGIANELGGSVSHLTSSPAELAAAIANAQGADPAVSALTQSAGQLLAAIANSAAGGGAPDFTGWSSGSEAGVYTDGVTGGKFPTGCSCLFDGAIVTIDEATHTAGGVECITITVDIVAAGEVIIYFPGFQASAEGQTWRAYLHAAAIENVDTEAALYGIAEFDAEDGGLDFNSEPIAEGLNDFDHTLGEGSAQVRGEILIASGVPSSLTMTFAAKLEQVV
jgi:hypothetical protein